jgi:hypothetical protein
MAPNSKGRATVDPELPGASVTAPTESDQQLVERWLGSRAETVV